MAELKDPLNNRAVKNCPVPYQSSLSEEETFVGKTVNWVLVRDFLKREGKLNKKILLQIVSMAQAIFSKNLFIQERKLT